VDAKDHVNGRLAAQISTVLQGKHKPSHHPGYDNGGTMNCISLSLSLEFSISFCSRKALLSSDACCLWAHWKLPSLVDYVVVINADKVQMSSKKKWQQKLYRWHTGYPGGLREVPAERMMRTHPTRIVVCTGCGVVLCELLWSLA
jgi:ribosomal protein L13